MSDVSQSSVVLDKELDEEKMVGRLPTPAFAARCAAGRPARRTNGSASAVIHGTLSTREASAQPAFTSGMRPSAFPVVDGRRTRTYAQ